MNESPFLQTALDYYKRGLFPIPKMRGKKHPAIKWKGIGPEKFSTQQITDWFAATNHQCDGICFLTGEAFGLLVIDLDEKPGVNGSKSMYQLRQERGGKLPITPVVQSGSDGDGLHLYFSPPKGSAIKSRADVYPGRENSGIDVRADGGVIIAPPSIHPESGKPYRWMPHRGIVDCDIAPAPEWLVELLSEAAPTIPPTQSFATGNQGKVTDGRERLMTRIVWRHICLAAQQSEKPPDADQIFQVAWPDYEKHAAPRSQSLEKDGRGPSAMREKVGYALTPLRWQEAVKTSSLLRTRNGTLHSNFANAASLLATSELGSCLAYNERSADYILTGWPISPEMAAGPTPRNLCDDDTLRVQKWLQSNGMPAIAKGTVQDAILHIAEKNRFDPVTDYLAGLKWDGIERLSASPEHIFRCSNITPYHPAVFRMFMIAAAARALQPGCKADYMLILEGAQGCGKSTACSILGGQHFSDSLPQNMTSKDALIHMIGPWIIEIGELAGLKYHDQNALKAILSRTEDTFRPPYGRAEITVKRRFVTIGTTNQREILRDPTGGRRYWPLVVGEIDLDRLRRERDQLWAEATAAFRDGETWHPTREFEREVIAPEQELRREEDPYEEPVRKYVAGMSEVRFSEVCDHLGVGWNRAVDQRRVSECLVRLGYCKTKKNGARFWTLGKHAT